MLPRKCTAALQGAMPAATTQAAHRVQTCSSSLSTAEYTIVSPLHLWERCPEALGPFSLHHQLPRVVQQRHPMTQQCRRTQQAAVCASSKGTWGCSSSQQPPSAALIGTKGTNH
jgi:hypothetical protein